MKGELKFREVCRVMYTNWKGETASRRIIPMSVRWGSNEYHPEAQWLVEGYDVDKAEYRTFALAGILEVLP
jgi:predicted DNA-binding transcriptional regulator YafY